MVSSNWWHCLRGCVQTLYGVQMCFTGRWLGLGRLRTANMDTKLHG